MPRISAKPTAPALLRRGCLVRQYAQPRNANRNYVSAVKNVITFCFPPSATVATYSRPMQQGEPDYDRPKESEPNRDHLRYRGLPLVLFAGIRALEALHQDHRTSLSLFDALAWLPPSARCSTPWHVNVKEPETLRFRNS